MRQSFKQSVLGLGAAATAVAMPVSEAQAQSAGSRYVNVAVSQTGTSERRNVRLDCNTLAVGTHGSARVLIPRVAFAAQFNLEKSEAEIQRYNAMGPSQKQSYRASMTPEERRAFDVTLRLPPNIRVQYLRAASDMRIVTQGPAAASYRAIENHVTGAHGVKKEEMARGANACKPYHGI